MSFTVNNFKLNKSKMASEEIIIKAALEGHKKSGCH